MSIKGVDIKVNWLRVLVFILCDAAIVFLSYMFGMITQDRNFFTLHNLLFIGVVLLVKIVVYYIAGIYRMVIGKFSVSELVKIAICVTSTTLLAFLANRFLQLNRTHYSLIEASTIVLILSMELILTIGYRSLKRVLAFYEGEKRNINTIIIGAGSAGKIAFDEIHNNLALDNNIICFVDDDKGLIGRQFLGKPIYGPIDNIHKYVEKYEIKEVIIAISDLAKDGLKRIVEILSKENVVIKRLPIVSEMDLKKTIKIQEVSLAELLGREQITFDTEEINNFVTGKRVLVTGAGGSIGSELVRQLYSYRPESIILFDIYENSTYDIQMELTRKIARDQSNVKLHTIIGSTYNEQRVEEIFKKFKPELVFHAAAYKHVPLMEDSPVEAIRTNVIGTYNVAKIAQKYNVEKMTLVSTDKAVRPTNTMGATKAFAEMIIRYFDANSTTTHYSAVRFGNVLGSNGSVIPLFKKQIAEGGPVTVTHKDIIRYFMTIPEAVSLILQSSTYAKGGEIFILDMGEPVKILTLAENVIKQCGFIPYEDIDIVFTGLRPGEKLYEELLLDVTEHNKTDNDKIYIEKSKKIQPVDEYINFIQGALIKEDNDEIKNMLRQVVTNYTDYKEFNAKNRR